MMDNLAENLAPTITPPTDLDSSSQDAGENPLLNHLVRFQIFHSFSILYVFLSLTEPLFRSSILLFYNFVIISFNLHTSHIWHFNALQILTKVLINLDNASLARSRAVNKQWYYEGTKLLKSRRYFAIISRSRPCEDLRDLNNLLKSRTQNSDDFLYNGLHLNVDFNSQVKCSKYRMKKGGESTVEWRHDCLYYKFPIKYFRINWKDPGLAPLNDDPYARNYSYDECPSFMLIPELLYGNSNTLEELEIEDLSYSSSWQELQYYAKGCPGHQLKLKVLKWKPEEANGVDLYTMRKMIRLAPNLEQLLMCVPGEILSEGIVAPDKYGIIKSLSFQCGLNESPRAYRTFALSNPKLRYLIVRYVGRWETDSFDAQSKEDDDREIEQLDMDQYWETFKLLVRSSRTSLEMLHIPGFAVVTQLTSDWYIFPHVTHLSWTYHCKIVQAKASFTRLSTNTTS